MDHHHHVAVLEVVDREGTMEKQRQQQQQQQQPELVRERCRRIKAAAELGLARSSRGRQWGRALGRRALVAGPAFEVTSSAHAGVRHAQRKAAAASPEGRGDEEEEEEEVEVEEKVALLRRLVPGGEDMAVDGLLEETADYIAALEAQVGVMRALACLLSGSGLDALPEKKKPHQ